MRHLLFGSMLLASIAGTAAAPAGDAADARKELASTGKLRVGVVSAPKADAFFVVKNADDRPRGVTVDLGDALARTLNVSTEFLVAHNSGEVTDALEKGLIDVAFMPVDDERRKRVEFGPAYVLFESTCLFAVPSVGEAIDMLRSGKVDAFALGRNALAPYQAEIPGSRILDGYFHRTGIAIAVPKNRPAALAHASAFLNEAKASGLIRRSFDNVGLQSTAVAPSD